METSAHRSLSQAAVLKSTEEFVQSRLGDEPTGHDWWHMDRVRNMALRIGKGEKVDLFVVELAALLHDIADWKFHDGDTDIGPDTARRFLEGQDVAGEVVAHVCEIVKTISFKGAGVQTAMRTLEGKVVQDADRLDSMGAIAIARTFAYGGNRGRLIHHPDIRPEHHETFEQYKAGRGTTINHFYEKLLLLKDRLNTETARKIAAGRHQFMETFLDRFLAEWEGDA